MAKVIPAIIPKTFQLLRSEMEQVSELVDRVQVDIIDGEFAPEPSWPYADTKEVGRFDELVNQKRGFPFWKDLQFELDMMVERPENVIDDWVQVGPSALIIHADSTDEFSAIADRLHESGTDVGLALKPKNSNELAKQHHDKIEFLQLMGNDKIGYHGVELDPLVYDKLEDIRAAFPDLDIGVDIGVNFDTAPELVEAGATRLISGSTIFESDNPAKAIEKLRGVDS